MAAFYQHNNLYLSHKMLLFPIFLININYSSNVYKINTVLITLWFLVGYVIIFCSQDKILYSEESLHQPKPNQSTETGFIASASFLSSSNRTDDRYLSPKLA